MTESLPLWFLLHVAAAAALLIWSVRLVRTGMERAFAHEMRKWLRRSAKWRITAAGTGTGAAILLQSSTAVALLVASFMKSGAIAPSIGLALLLGADLGSAIVTQILILRPDWITALLLLVGVALFMKGARRSTRQVGRVLIGFALIFVSLDLIAEAAVMLPVEMLESVTAYLSRDLGTAFLVGATLAWLMHSSVAAVLLFATLAATGALGGHAAIAMVLGANLGGSLIAVTLTLKSATDVRRIIAANLLARGGAAVAVLWALGYGVIDAAFLGDAAAKQAIRFHVAFNLALLILALPLTGPLLKSVGFVIREASGPADLETTSLDAAALDEPSRALVCARREILRMGEEIEAMLRSVLPLFAAWDDQSAEEILFREKRVDHMHFHTKLYLSRLMRDGESEASEPAADLVALAAQLEAAGDEISSTMLNMARRLHSEGRAFSEQGWRELTDFHDRVLSNVQKALQVIMQPEVDIARALVEEKDALRQVEERMQMSHLSRLRRGLSESVETSNIHQETLRSLKAVNSAFATAAHPTLKGAGEILTTRLAKPAA